MSRCAARALAERSGTTTIAAPRVNGILQEEWASISKDYAALRQGDPRIEAIETWSVPMLRLDDAGLTDVAAMKIDVEGAELEVLRGAWMTLRRRRPLLSIEIEERHRTGSTRAVPELLHDLGYEGWSNSMANGVASSSWISQRCSVPPRHRRSSRCRTPTCSASISCRANAGRS
jgi:FkbM family methyltransferase